MSLNVFGKVGDITSAAFNKVGDTLQDTSKGLASSFEDAFEIRGEKTEAQLEMERWQAEQNGAALQTAAEINASLSGAATHSPGKTGMAGAASSASDRDHGVIGSDPESLAAVGKVASALKEAEGIQGDDQASVFDKVIHQQRMQLAKLNKERQALAEERRRMEAEMKSLKQADGTPGSAAGPLPGISGGKPAEKSLFAGLVAVLLVLRMQRSLDGSPSVDDTWEVQVERAEMEKLVGDLLRDKALLVKDKRGPGGDGKGGGGNATAASREKAMDRHLATVQRMLGKVQKKQMGKGNHYDRSNELSKQNHELASELKTLREQIARLRNSTKV